MTRDEAYNFLKHVRGEWDAARFALATVLRQMAENLDFKQESQHISETELTRCARNLEVTFVLRVFAEFEAVLRNFWVATVRTTRPDMMPLMNAIAARLGIGPDDLAGAHRIRDFRNDIIHENLRDARFTFSECLKALNTYLRWLPLNW